MVYRMQVRSYIHLYLSLKHCFGSSGVVFAETCGLRRMALCGASADFEISLSCLKTILQIMRELGRQSSHGIPCLESKWYDNWDEVQNEALEISAARAHYLHKEQDEILLLRVKTLIFWCIRGSVHGWDSLRPKFQNESSVLQIPCLRTEWCRQGTWHGRRLEVYKKDLGPAIEDLRSLALRTADRADLQREHEWFRAAADLCEITMLRPIDGSFES